MLTLVPTPLHPDMPLDSESLKRLQEALLSPLTVIVQEERKVASKRWVQWGLPREWINQFYYLNEHTTKTVTQELGQLLLDGKQVYLMSDGGLPVINDPGVDLVHFCHRNQIRVTSFPFCNSALLAVALSGFKCDRFLFEGFLPKDEAPRKSRLQQVLRNYSLTILLEAPYRLQKLLGELQEQRLDRHIFLATNLGTPEEQLWRGSIDQVKEKAQKLKKAEFVLVIKGRD